MSKLMIVEAVKVIRVSESKLRRDLKAELERVYGLLTANENVKNGSGGHDTAEILAIKEFGKDHAYWHLTDWEADEELEDFLWQ